MRVLNGTDVRALADIGALVPPIAAAAAVFLGTTALAGPPAKRLKAPPYAAMVFGGRSPPHRSR